MIQFNIEKGKQAEKLLVELSKPVAKRIISLLTEINHELSVTDIFCRLRLAQSDVSASLIKLRQTGILSARRKGNIIYNSIDQTRMNEISEFARKLSEMFHSKPDHRSVTVQKKPTRVVPMREYPMLENERWNEKVN